jgi:hypothetical protein
LGNSLKTLKRDILSNTGAIYELFIHKANFSKKNSQLRSCFQKWLGSGTNVKHKMDNTKAYTAARRFCCAIWEKNQRSAKKGALLH